MRVLALNTALAVAVAGVVEDGRVVREAAVEGGRGMVERLPALVAGVLEGERVSLIAAVVGPGSFTGIRAGLALAHGLAIGFGCDVVGVTVRDALSVGLGLAGAGALWVATDALRGGVFLEGDGPARTVAVEGIGAPDSGTVAVAGDRADAVVLHLVRLGAAARLADRLVPCVADVAAAGLARFSGRLEGLAALPLYVDGPEVSRPAVAPRPAPA